MKKLTSYIVNDIIRVLDDRKGFGYWWNDIDPENRNEIIEEMGAAIEKRYYPLNEVDSPKQKND